MTNSREKGKKGELEFAHFLNGFGINAFRGVQYQGGQDSPDVVTELTDFHFEVKRVERFMLYNSLKQAIKDAGAKIPVVAHRQNRAEWVVILRASDFLGLVKDKDYDLHKMLL